jgi:predicted DNA binding CopG/RHH family protein
MADELGLDAEEQTLVDSYERGAWQSIGDLQEKRQHYQAYASAALEAIGLVSIVLPQEDLKAIRQRAAEAGVSHQALIADVVHEFVTGHLVEKAGA